MLIPIVMLVLCLTLPYPAIRWVTLVAAAFLVVFNLAGLPYEGAYDNFLIVVSIVFCGLIVLVCVDVASARLASSVSAAV